LTLFKRWYLTAYSINFLDLDWRSDKVVSWGEYNEFTKDNTLYWNSRMGGGNTTYRLSGISSGNLTASTFSAVNMDDSEDNREFLIESLTEKYLLLYDKKENLHRAFIASDYAKFPGNSDNNGSDNDDDNNDNDEDDDEDDDNDDNDSSGIKCNRCHGSGKCIGINRCGGTGDCTYCADGWNSDYGVEHKCGVCDGTDECSFCDGTGECRDCGGTGYR